MGIQVHSFYDYKLATLLIQSGIVGRVSRVRAWSPKNWGYDGQNPKGSDPVPSSLDWNLWLGTAVKRPFKEKFITLEIGENLLILDVEHSEIWEFIFLIHHTMH